MALVNEKQAAERLGLSHRTLQRWRVEGKGPAHIKLCDAAVRYDSDTIAAFIADGQRRSTSDPGAHATTA